MASDIIERWKAQLCLPLLPFTHATSESINADSLNSNFLQLGRKSGGRPQRAVHPMRLPVNAVIHTTLVGLEPATFRSLVDCWSDELPVVPPSQPLQSQKSQVDDLARANGIVVHDAAIYCLLQQTTAQTLQQDRHTSQMSLCRSSGARPC